MRSGNLVNVRSLAVDEPEVYGRFVLLSRLGTGGMAELFAARPRGPSNLPPLFALKRMLPADACRPEFVAMFVDEAKVVARLDHPNIVRSYEYGQHAGLYYIAMELVRGLDLRRVQMLLGKKNERIPLEVSVWIIEKVCEALAHAHTTKDDEGKPLNLIHRDITPHNLMVAFDGVVKVVDFGIAKTALQSTATRVGTLKGKVHYMSPEQARGEKVDRRCDLYAASICLWELLAGREAFDREETYINALQRAAEPQIPPIRSIRQDVPPDLAAILAQGLAREPVNRFQEATEMAQALHDVGAKLGSGGQLGLARWLRERFTRIREAQGRVLSRVATTDGSGTVDAEASTIRGVSVVSRPDALALVSSVSAREGDEPPEGPEVFFSVDVDVELPPNADHTLPYAPALAADPWVNAAPTEVDIPPGFDLQELWVAFGTETGDSDDPVDIHVEQPIHDMPTGVPRGVTAPIIVSREPVAPAVERPPQRSRALTVIGLATLVGAAIIGAAIFYGPMGRPSSGRLEIAADADVPMEITVDGRRTGEVIDAIAPGRHAIEVRADGYEPFVRDVAVAEGGTTLVAVALRRIEAPDVEEDAPLEVVSPAPIVVAPEPTPEAVVPPAAPVRRRPRARPEPSAMTEATPESPSTSTTPAESDRPSMTAAPEPAPTMTPTATPTMAAATTPAPTMAAAAPAPTMAAAATPTPTMAAPAAPAPSSMAAPAPAPPAAQ